jgi:hypothetical protein
MRWRVVENKPALKDPTFVGAWSTTIAARTTGLSHVASHAVKKPSPTSFIPKHGNIRSQDISGLTAVMATAQRLEGTRL